VTLAGPKAGAGKVLVSGFAAPGALARGPLSLRVRAGARDLGSATLRDPGQTFDLRFDLPKEFAGQYALRITIQASRTFRAPNDIRELGIVIRRIEVLPATSSPA
jgi:hypothetical protein